MIPSQLSASPSPVPGCYRVVLLCHEYNSVREWRWVDIAPFFVRLRRVLYVNLESVRVVDELIELATQGWTDIVPRRIGVSEEVCLTIGTCNECFHEGS